MGRRVAWLMALANALAAYGGGSVMRGGVEVIPNAASQYLPEASILGFLVGTALGLLFMLLLPRVGIPASLRAATGFSLAAAATSLALLLMVSSQLVTGPVVYVFFLLLCLRFSFWFLPRAFRVGQASILGQLPLVESAYYAGTTLGLAAPPGRIITLATPFAVILVVDAILQCTAAGVDFLSHRVARVPAPQSAAAPLTPPTLNRQRRLDLPWYARMVVAMTALTVGCQILPFNLASAWIHQAKLAKERGPAPEAVGEGTAASDQEIRGDAGGPQILSVFYLSIALSALGCHMLNARFEWTDQGKGGRGLAVVTVGESHTPYLAISLSSFALVALAVLTYWFDRGDVLLGALVALSGSLYEILYLVLYRRIASETSQELTVRALGVVAFGSALAWWALRVTESPPAMWLFVLAGCALAAATSVCYRSEAGPPTRAHS